MSKMLKGQMRSGAESHLKSVKKSWNAVRNTKEIIETGRIGFDKWVKDRAPKEVGGELEDSVWEKWIKKQKYAHMDLRFYQSLEIKWHGGARRSLIEYKKAYKEAVGVLQPFLDQKQFDDIKLFKGLKYQDFLDPIEEHQEELKQFLKDLEK